METGRYKILRPLGEGGMGRVFLAVDQEKRGTVALKFLNMPRDPAMRQRFKKEAALLSELSHPGLLKIFDFFEQAPWTMKDLSGPFFAMEYLEGKSLSSDFGSIDEAQALEWLIDLLQGLHYLHSRGVYHRDLKPSNVWITGEGKAKLLDFGLAYFREEVPLGKKSSLPAGTLIYLPPESFWGDYTAQSDLFSLGVLFYEKLSGRLPYLKPLTKMPDEKDMPPRLHVLRSDLPSFLCDLIDRLCSLNPSQRPSSAWTALAYLNQHLENPISGVDATTIIVEKVPLIGREREWNRFWQDFQAWEASAPSLWFSITGPQGVGRSRFLEEIKWALQLKGKFYFSVRPHESEAWWNSLLSQLSVEDKFSSAEEIFAWTKILFERSPQAGLALAFVDLHDWPDASLQALEAFLKIAQRGPKKLWIFLEYCEEKMKMRGDAIRALAQSWEFHRHLGINDLTLEQTVELLRQANVGRQISLEVLQKIATSSGGRPLLALESLRQYGVAQRAMSLGQEALFEVPQSFRESSRLKVNVLSSEAQALLALFLTHPLEFSREQILKLFSKKEVNFQNSIEELQQKDFIREPERFGDVFRFSHPSLKEIYLEFLPKCEIERAHRLWLAALEDKTGCFSEEDELLAKAHHAWSLKDWARVRQWALKAAEICGGRGRSLESIEWYQRLIEATENSLDRSLAYAHLAPIYFRLGRFDEALQAYDQWLSHRGDDDSFLQKLKHRFYTGLTLYSAGKLDEAEARLLEALQLGQAKKYPSHRPYLARASLLLGAIIRRRGDVEKVRLFFLEAAQLGESDNMLVGEAEQRLGLLAQSKMEYAAAQEHFERCLFLYRQAKNRRGEAVAIHALGMLRREEGEMIQAIACLREAVGLAEGQGELLQSAQFRENLALALLEAGQFEEAAREFESSWEVLRVLGKEEDRLLSQLHQIYFFVQIGNTDRALRRLKKIQERENRLSELGYICSFHLLQGELSLLCRKFTQAADFFCRSLNKAREQHRPWEICLSLWGWVRSSLYQHGELRPPVLGDAFKLSLSSPQVSLYVLWEKTADIFLKSEIPEDEILNLLTLIQKCERPDIQRELYLLLAVFFKGKRCLSFARKFFQLADKEWGRQYADLPEELKMDFEKKRPSSLDQALDQLLPERDTAEKINPESRAHVRPMEGIPESRFRQYSEINRQLAQRMELSEILERVMDAAIELTGAERGFLILKNEEQKSKPLPGYEVRCARHLNHVTLQEADFRFSMTAVKQAMDQGAGLLTDNAQLDPRLQERQSVVQFQLKSILAAPLEIEGEILGAIYLDHRFQPNCFSDQDVVLLEAFATQAALAIQKAQMVEALKEAKKRLEEKVEAQAAKIEKISTELAEVRDQLKYGYEEIVGQSPPMMQVFQLLDHVTETSIPVWIWGESGTGKELIARSLHFNSPRKEGPFVTENCSAIPETLLESELFGHKKGAFTHADRDRVGLFEQAHRGTLFLDEIADMPLNMQVKLLRVLQEGEIRPLGSNKKIKIDVRLVTASNKDLAKLVKEGKFRQDLFFRINGLTIKLPPLRERKDDIPLLVDHMIKKICRDFGLQKSEVSDEAFQVLIQHHWLGNIRELEAVIRNALLFAKGRLITPEFIQFSDDSNEKRPLKSNGTSDRVQEDSEERQVILDALRKHHMHKEEVAKDLGISLRSLYTRMEKLNIPKKKTILAKYLNFN